MVLILLDTVPKKQEITLFCKVRLLFRMFKRCRILLFLAITSFLFACGDGGGSSGIPETGAVSMSLTDSTTDLYRAVYITINDLQICINNNDVSDNNCNWSSLEPPDGTQFPKTYNLLKLINGVTEAIGSGEFSAGTYNQIRLIIGLTPELKNNLLGEPHPAANYIIFNDGVDTVEQLKIPSGLQTGIKLTDSFKVDGGEIKDLVLDFDACRSVVKAGNSIKYILKPNIKVIEPKDKIDINGTVSIKVASENKIAGALVSAQISDGLSATVARSTISDNGGNYLLSLLSPDQTYNIVAYSAGKIPACKAFLYKDLYDEDLLPSLDFELSEPESEAVKISGTVSVDGTIEDDFPLIVTIYAKLDCNHPDGESYVELTKVDGITYVDADNTFKYNIDLPKYDDQVTYYIEASAEGYIPYAVMVEISEEETEVTNVSLLNVNGEILKHVLDPTNGLHIRIISPQLVYEPDYLLAGNWNSVGTNVSGTVRSSNAPSLELPMQGRNFEYSLTLQPGWNYFVVEASDNEGQEAKNEHSVYYVSFVGMDLNDGRLLALHSLVSDIYASYGLSDDAPAIVRARILRDWVARHMVHPDKRLHPNSCTTNKGVLPPGVTWDKVNAILNDSKVTDDQEFWASYHYDGYAMIDALLGTLDRPSGSRSEDGLMVQVSPGHFRIRDITEFRYAFCTYKVAVLQVLWAAAGFQSMMLSSNAHDTAAVLIPGIGWVYSDPTFNEELYAFGFTEPLSPQKIFELIRNGDRDDIFPLKGCTENQQGPLWDTEQYIPQEINYITMVPKAFTYLRACLNNQLLGGNLNREIITIEGSEDPWQQHIVPSAMAFRVP